MIYLVGASHIQAILDGCRDPQAPAPDFADGQPPAFRDWPVQAAVGPGAALRVASLYVGHTSRHWGTVLAELLPNGRLGIAAGLRELMAEPAADPRAAAVFLSMRGEEYYQLANHGIAQPYDFVLPERPDLAPDPERALLPLRLVQNQLRHGLMHTLLTLTALRKLCPAQRLVRIVPPPPGPSEEVAALRAAGAVTTPNRVEAVPSAVRLKLWLLYARLVEEGVASLGLETLAPPPQALRPDGLLRREYLKDAIHGNAAYGELVAQQMAALLRPTLAEAA